MPQFDNYQFVMDSQLQRVAKLLGGKQVEIITPTEITRMRLLKLFKIIGKLTIQVFPDDLVCS